ncbi:MAG TPA: hypothetical protein VMS87_01000 [Roseiarcus sp.]|nr:hypothetical protein [Roseiarcus sp.]
MTTTTEVSEAVPLVQRLIAPRWDNWRGALIVFIAGMAVAIALLPPNISFWASALLAALFAATVVVNAWAATPAASSWRPLWRSCS